jgi:endonuclease/exonuclease/phosphatase family metal-dependent hydrolase
MMSGQSLRVATYNLRFDNPRDSLNAWPHRSDYVTNLILLHDFDIFGTQEGLKHQLEDLKTGLNFYDYIGVGRDDGDTQGEHAAIFYKTDKLKLQSHGDFWLSPVTEKPNKGWDAALPRICTWGRFKDIGSGKEFYLFNVHFDHLGEMARRESAKLIINKIGEIANGIPCILTGDFNFDEHHESYTYLNTSGLLKDTYDLADIRYAPDGTFNGFNVNSIPEGRIDHIFITPAFRVRRYGILTNTYHNRYPSDHFPVFAEIRFH